MARSIQDYISQKIENEKSAFSQQTEKGEKVLENLFNQNKNAVITGCCERRLPALAVGR